MANRGRPLPTPPGKTAGGAPPPPKEEEENEMQQEEEHESPAPEFGIAPKDYGSGKRGGSSSGESSAPAPEFGIAPKDYGSGKRGGVPSSDSGAPPSEFGNAPKDYGSGKRGGVPSGDSGAPAPEFGNAPKEYGSGQRGGSPGGRGVGSPNVGRNSPSQGRVGGGPAIKGEKVPTFLAFVKEGGTDVNVSEMLAKAPLEADGYAYAQKHAGGDNTLKNPNVHVIKPGQHPWINLSHKDGGRMEGASAKKNIVLPPESAWYG